MHEGLLFQSLAFPHADEDTMDLPHHVAAASGMLHMGKSIANTYFTAGMPYVDLKGNLRMESVPANELYRSASRTLEVDVSGSAVDAALGEEMLVRTEGSLALRQCVTAQGK